MDIFEKITTGTAILHLSAQDRDLDAFIGLRYSIVSGNSLERFFIDAFSGVIYVKSPIDRDPPRSETSFLLTVINIELIIAATKIRLINLFSQLTKNALQGEGERRVGYFFLFWRKVSPLNLTHFIFRKKWKTQGS